MRKLFAIAFTCVYLLLTVGVAKTTHYCMGRERFSTLFTFQSKFCCPPQPESDFSCCHDDIELIKITDDQQVSLSTTISIPDFFLIHEFTFPETISQFNQQPLEFKASYAEKPPLTHRPFYDLHCSLIFYEA
ncbi:MAG: hypothetical protein L0Y35_03330 [Flammeovirgaceae bacterium]|nr:hypothetical protein [Flammeovirgaceae bacterium]